MSTADGVVVHLDEADPDNHAAVLRNIGTYGPNSAGTPRPSWSRTAPASTSA